MPSRFSITDSVTDLTTDYPSDPHIALFRTKTRLKSLLAFG